MLEANIVALYHNFLLSIIFPEIPSANILSYV